MHEREGTAARFGQYSSLGDPILEDCQLQRLRSVSLETVSNRISVRLSHSKMHIHALAFGFSVKAYICRRGKNVILVRLRPLSRSRSWKTHILWLSQGSRPPQKELFSIRSPRRLGKGNIDLSSNCFQLMLRVLELVAQGPN
jgi:hypothetical protein